VISTGDVKLFCEFVRHVSDCRVCNQRPFQLCPAARAMKQLLRPPA